VSFDLVDRLSLIIRETNAGTAAERAGQLAAGMSGVARPPTAISKRRDANAETSAGKQGNVVRFQADRTEVRDLKSLVFFSNHGNGLGYGPIASANPRRF
jgi:hypothetical protein